MSQTWQKQQQPLDTLQSMINGVLIETGKALRSANRKGVATIGRADNRLQLFLPNALEKFHLALDELESDIVRAKAVLSRDLRDLQAKRIQLEHPIEQQVKGTADITEDEKLNQPSSPQLDGIASPEAVSEMQDFINPENSAPDDAPVRVGTPPKPKVESPPSSLKSPRETQNEISSQQKHSSEAEAVESQATLGVSKAEVAEELPPDPGLSAVSEATEALGLQSTDFDSMFDTNNNGDSDLNFDSYDFGGDSTGNQNQDFVNNGEGFDLSSFGNQDSNENGGSNSLLQGLDNFGDGSAGDFAMLDAANTTANQEVGDNAGADFDIGGGDLDLGLSMGNDGSTFDELLNGMDFGDGLDDGSGGHMMEHGEFDDAFFGLNSDA